MKKVRLSPEAQVVFKKAKQLSKKSGDSILRFEHLVLSMLSDVENVGGRILRALKLSGDDVVRVLQEIARHLKEAPECGNRKSNRTIELLLEDAGHVATQFRHPYIGTEHLLARMATYDTVSKTTCAHFPATGGFLSPHRNALYSEVLLLHGNCKPRLPWEAPMLGKLIGSTKLKKIMKDLPLSHELLSDVLVKGDYLTRSQLNKWESEYMGVVLENLMELKVRGNVVSLLTKAYAWSREIMPIAIHEGALYLAIHDESQAQLDDTLKALLARFHPLHWVQCPRQQVLGCLGKAYGPKPN
jgi:hypothetical protein